MGEGFTRGREQSVKVVWECDGERGGFGECDDNVKLGLDSSQ